MHLILSLSGKHDKSNCYSQLNHKLHSIFQIFTRQSEMVKLFVLCATYFNLKRIFDCNAILLNGQMSISTEHLTLVDADDLDLQCHFGQI
jgi:hypothetical protein